MTKIRVLGHVVSKRGIEPDPIKIKAIQEAPIPTNVSDLKSFLGICGYMSKFIPNYANLVEPLLVEDVSHVRMSNGPGVRSKYNPLSS